LFVKTVDPAPKERNWIPYELFQGTGFLCFLLVLEKKHGKIKHRHIATTQSHKRESDVIELWRNSELQLQKTTMTDHA